MVPCLALASRFPPAGDNNDDRDHVDNGSGDDDSHDETLMLSRGIYILSSFMASQTPTQISDFVAADSDDRNAKKSEIIMMIIMMMHSRASLQLAGGIHRAGSLGRRGTLCQPCPRSLGTAARQWHQTVKKD